MRVTCPITGLKFTVEYHDAFLAEPEEQNHPLLWPKNFRNYIALGKHRALPMEQKAILCLILGYLRGKVEVNRPFIQLVKEEDYPYVAEFLTQLLSMKEGDWKHIPVLGSEASLSTWRQAVKTSLYILQKEREVNAATVNTALKRVSEKEKIRAWQEEIISLAPSLKKLALGITFLSLEKRKEIYKVLMRKGLHSLASIWSRCYTFSVENLEEEVTPAFDHQKDQPRSTPVSLRDRLRARLKK